MMFLNIHICLIILKADDTGNQFTLNTKIIVAYHF